MFCNVLVVARLADDEGICYKTAVIPSVSPPGEGIYFFSENIPPGGKS